MTNPPGRISDLLAAARERAQEEGDALADQLKKTIWTNQDARLRRLPTRLFVHRHAPDDPAICVASRDGHISITSYTTYWDLTYLSLTAGAQELLLMTSCTRGPGHIVQLDDDLPEDVPIKAAKVLSLLDRFCDGWEKFARA